MTENNESENPQIEIEQGNYNERIEGNYIQGNYYEVKFNFRRENKNYAQIRQKLLEIVTKRLEYLIDSSLDNRVYVVPEMEQNPEQIESPLLGEVKVNFQRKITLNNTDIINVFDLEDVAGRLLILGQPGSGKTTILYKLALELVKRANENFNHPIPVLFSLSSWKNDSQSIKDWLINELKDKYGVRKDIGKGLVDDQEIIPLLDGLDELAAERQENCVIKINEFLQPSNWTNPVVVCSRIQEYERYKALLQLNNSIELYPLSQEQIYQYLRNTDNLQLWESISHDSDLSQLAQTPLLLNMIVLSAEEISIQTWQQFKSSEERLSYLFDAYIRRMLKRPYKGKDKQPHPENTQRWLTWLANRLIEESAIEFLIERMQPYWLKNKIQRVIYVLIVSLFFSTLMVVSWLIIIMSLSRWNVVILVIIAVVSLVWSLVKSEDNFRIKTAERFRFSLDIFLKSITKLGSLVAFFGIFLLSLLVASTNIFMSIVYVIFGAFYIINMSLNSGVEWIEIENKTVPNEGIRRSVINSIVMLLLASLLAILSIKIKAFIPEDNLSKPILNDNLRQLLILVLYLSIFSSGMPVIKHFILRIILWSNGYIPWNYAKFLDYCTDRLFLQRVGGGYRFMHDLLRQHFANS